MLHFHNSNTLKIFKCSRLSREIQSLKKTKTETQEERDIDLRELKSFNKTIDKLLADVLEANPDLTTPFQMYFHQVSFPVNCHQNPNSSSLLLSAFQGQLLTGKSVHLLSTSVQIQRIINPPDILSPIIQLLGQLFFFFSKFSSPI